MAGREPEAVGMGVKVGQAQGARLEDQQAEDAVPLGPRPDARCLVIAEPDGDEFGEPGPDSSSTPRAAYLASTRSAAVSVMRRSASPSVCSEPIAMTASSRRSICFAPANWKRLGTGGGYGPAPVGCDRARRDVPGPRGPIVIRVFLVDDHEIVRRGVRELLESTDDLEVVGEAGTAAEAVQRIPATAPDVAILDVRLPDGSGIEVCRDLRSMLPDLRCLMLTSYNDDEALFDAIVAGASGYVLKEVRGSDLIESVRRVAGGQSLLDPTVTARVIDRMRNPPKDALTASLTPQETVILGHLADGLTNRQIAEHMFLAEKTVKNYVSNLLGSSG